MAQDWRKIVSNVCAMFLKMCVPVEDILVLLQMQLPPVKNHPNGQSNVQGANQKRMHILTPVRASVANTVAALLIERLRFGYFESTYALDSFRAVGLNFCTSGWLEKMAVSCCAQRPNFDPSHDGGAAELPLHGRGQTMGTRTHR